MYCTRCGKKLPEDCIICEYCNTVVRPPISPSCRRESDNSAAAAETVDPGINDTDTPAHTDVPISDTSDTPTPTDTPIPEESAPEPKPYPVFSRKPFFVGATAYIIFIIFNCITLGLMTEFLFGYEIRFDIIY